MLHNNDLGTQAHQPGSTRITSTMTNMTFCSLLCMLVYVLIISTIGFHKIQEDGFFQVHVYANTLILMETRVFDAPL